MEEAKKKRVLIIEDEDAILRVESALIKVEESGCFEPENSGVVVSPDQALEYIEKYNSDRIVMDMNYGSKPRLDDTADGFKVIEALSENDRKKIIAVSGSIDFYIEMLRPLGIRHFNDKFAFVKCLSDKCDCNARR